MCKFLSRTDALKQRRHFVLFAVVTFTHYACRRDRDTLRGQAKWQQKEEEKIVECFVPSHIAGYVNCSNLVANVA